MQRRALPGVVRGGFSTWAPTALCGADRYGIGKKPDDKPPVYLAPGT